MIFGASKKSGSLAQKGASKFFGGQVKNLGHLPKGQVTKNLSF
jgi:hypothetical protein